MQFRKKLSLLIWTAGLLAVASVNLSGQELRENEKGEKIIVYPDGSWQYFSNFGDQTNNGMPPKKVNDNEEAYPVFDGKVEPLDGAISLTEEDIFKIATRRAQIAGEAAEIARQRSEEATRQRKLLEKQYQQASQSGEVNSSKLRQLLLRLEAAKKTEREAGYEARQALQEMRRAEELTEKGNYVKEFNEYQRRKREEARISLSQEQLAQTSYANILPFGESYYLSPDEENVILNPPPGECKIAFAGIDEYTGRHRRDVHKQLLFTYTDERLRLYLKDKEYLRCEGFFTSVAGGFWFLSLEFTFAYPNAREAYGFIEKGSVLTIKLLNGDFVNLRAGKMDRGSYDTEKELLTYRVFYPIDRSQVNLLKNSEVDSIRVFWSSGYEEYEVFNLNFFIDQINCLEK